MASANVSNESVLSLFLTGLFLLMAGVDVFELQAQIGGLSLGLVSGYHRVGKRLGGGLVDLILRGVPEDPRFGLAPGISGSVDAMHAPAQGSEDGEDCLLYTSPSPRD